jgi:hypothetical protein
MLNGHGDNVYYYVDWGDGDSELTDFYKSGEVATVGHTYLAIGTIIISAYAEDIYGAEGPEGTYIVEWKNKGQSDQQSSNSLFFKIVQRLLNTR